MKFSVLWKKAIGGVSIIFFTSQAFADIGGAALPASTLPEQVSKSITSQQPTTENQTLPPVIAAPKPPPTALGEQAKKIKFQLNGIILKGNHIYSDADLKPLYEHDLHKTISVAELFTIVQNITNFYRNNGYILSRAVLPPQHVKGGVVQIQIIEGYIGQVDVTGNPQGAGCMVQLFGNKIKQCPPLQLSRMEKYLLLANEIPGTQVRAVLSPSKKQVGAADLTLVTDNKRYTGYFSYDDYGTRYIGPQQLTGNLGMNSFAISGDSGQITFTKTAKGGELTYTDINYNLPVDDNGTRWLLGGTRAHTHPLFVLQPIQIDGLNDNYYTTVYFPIIRTRSQSLTLRAGFNYLDSHVTFLDFNLYTDHIRSLDFGFSYNFSDRFYGSNLISFDYRQGLPILGYTSDVNPDTAQTSRPGGHGAYSKFMATVSRLQAIKGPVSAYVLAQGQTACNPLLSSEQFAFGGSQLGRGYDVAEIIGDKGMAGSAELRYDLSVNRLLIQNLQFYAFYDIGVIYNFKFIGGTPRQQSAASTGFGVRFFLTKYVSGNFMWTQSLTKPVAAEQLIGDGRRPRMFFSVVASL